MQSTERSAARISFKGASRSERRRFGARRDVQRHDLVEHRERTTRCLAPREAVHALEAELAHSLAQLRGAGDFAESAGDVLFVQRIDQPRGAAGDLWPRA